MGSAIGRVPATGRIPETDRVIAINRVSSLSRGSGMLDHAGNGLQAYYRTDPETITLISGKVSQWADISGNAKHASQSLTNRRPIVTANWSGNNSGITFSSSTVLRIASSIQTTKFPLTMGGVFQSTSNSSGRSIFCPAGQLGGDYLSIRASGAANREVTANQNTQCQDGAATTNIEVWVATIEPFIPNPLLGVHKLFITTAGVQQTLSPNTITVFTPTDTQSYIGAISTSALQPFTGGVIGELFFINRLLSSDEITRYLSYVQGRYGTI